jgi:hypothetical protein
MQHVIIDTHIFEITKVRPKNPFIKWFLGVCLYSIGACSVIFPQLLPKLCTVEGTLGCVGNDLQVCHDNFIVAEPCVASVCTEGGEFSFCAAPITCTTTEPVAISGTAECETVSSNAGRKAAVDLGGHLYTAMRCGGTAHVASSEDCGQSFGPLINTQLNNLIDFAIEGGPNDFLFLAAINNNQELTFSRSQDRGLTWEAPRILASGLDASILNVVSLASLGRSVFIAIKINGLAFVLRNEDLGVGAFESLGTIQPAVFFDILIDKSSGDLFLGSDDPSFHLSKSIDNAVTFGSIFNPPGQVFESDWAIGNGLIYVTGKNAKTLTIIPSDNLSFSAAVDGLPSTSVSFSRAIDADLEGNAYITTQLDSGVLQLDHLNFNANGFDVPLVIDKTGTFPGVKALLSNNGALLVYTVGTTVFAKVQVF